MRPVSFVNVPIPIGDADDVRVVPSNAVRAELLENV